MRLPPWDTVLVLWPRRRSIFLATLTRFLPVCLPVHSYQLHDPTSGLDEDCDGARYLLVNASLRHVRRKL